MCEDKENKTLDELKNDFNKLSKDHLGGGDMC